LSVNPGTLSYYQMAATKRRDTAIYARGAPSV